MTRYIYNWGEEGNTRLSFEGGYAEIYKITDSDGHWPFFFTIELHVGNRTYWGQSVTTQQGSNWVYNTLQDINS